MQVEQKTNADESLPGPEAVSGSLHRWLTWLESIIDRKHWPSLRILFTGNLLLPILFLGSSLS
ncbi:MAG: hypothetical protein P8163_20360, partial [Candidatus Thiodiazotropha sp.]